MSVVTGEVTDITTNSAEVSGSIKVLGEDAIQHGHCYSKTPNPSIDNNRTQNGIPLSIGSYYSQIINLDPNTKYYVRAYMSNYQVAVYGEEINFLTNSCTAPTASTSPATDITSTLATLNGTINANGSSTSVTFEYGTTTSYGNEITATESPVTGSSSTAVSASISGLISNTIYHYRVKAVNCGGTTYGSDQTFTTLSGLVAYYPFNGSANDLSGNNIHGTVYGATPAIDRFGNTNSAYYFDGIDDYIKITYDQRLYPSSITISFWLKRSNYDNPQHESVMSNSGGGIDPPYDPFGCAFIEGDNHLTVSINGDNDTQFIPLISQTEFDTNKWYHVCVFYNEITGEVAFYLNGIKEDSEIVFMNLCTNELGMIIGTGQTSSGDPWPDTYFKGYIDDLRVYNIGISEAEIWYLYHEGGWAPK